VDVLTLSRLQFAVASYFHFLFVPLTLGLSILVAMMETRYVRTGDEDYKRMAKYWGTLFLINFAVGVVTGLTLEFQFGTNWSRYADYVGDIFGSLLAVEATVAFFLESTFIAVWVFGWTKLSRKAHCAAIWAVAVATNLSAFWILVANAWMQHPVGFTIRNGRAELTDFFGVITQRLAILKFIHTVGGGYILAGFFVLGVSAWHLLAKRETAFFTKAFRMAAAFSLVFALFEVAQGHMNAEILSEMQPTKLAAMEAHWDTGARAPMYLLAWPDQPNERNTVQTLAVPGGLSMLAGYSPDTVVKGLKDYPAAQRPPVLPVFLSFRAMVGLAFLFLAVGLYAFLKRRTIDQAARFLRVMPWLIPLPYLANLLGWTIAELGRQPWIVYGMMQTKDAVSPIAPGQVAGTLVGFFLLYSFLGLVDFYLLRKYARKGPDAGAAAPPAPDGAPATPITAPATSA